jgi:DNA invertase Pin-like site-specific DNA recombinase
MTGVLIGYARCSTDKQDLEANRQILLDLGVAADLVYLDRVHSGTTRVRPGLDQALPAVRPDDTLIVPKRDRLARSVPTRAGSATRWWLAGSGCSSVRRPTTRATARGD